MAKTTNAAANAAAGPETAARDEAAAQAAAQGAAGHHAAQGAAGHHAAQGAAGHHAAQGAAGHHAAEPAAAEPNAQAPGAAAAAVCAGSEALCGEAAALAARLGLPFLGAVAADGGKTGAAGGKTGSVGEKTGVCGGKTGGGLLLRLDEQGLALTDGELTLRGDFARLLPRVRESNLRAELLVKAARGRGLPAVPTAIDATAGLGEDAFLLAAAGFSVRLYERDPVIAALLADALRRALLDERLQPIAARMRLFAEDSRAALAELTAPPDVVLLDPMFPARQKSGRIGLKFQLLQRLERPEAEGEALLLAALSARPRRILVKRPRKGPYLGGRRPDFSYEGKAVRIDVLLAPGK